MEIPASSVSGRISPPTQPPGQQVGAALNLPGSNRGVSTTASAAPERVDTVGSVLNPPPVPSSAGQRTSDLLHTSSEVLEGQSPSNA